MSNEEKSSMQIMVKECGTKVNTLEHLICFPAYFLLILDNIVKYSLGKYNKNYNIISIMIKKW